MSVNLRKPLTGQEFHDYLEVHGGLYSPPNVILLKKRYLSDFYADQRIFNEKLDGWEKVTVKCLADLARVYVHHNMLCRIGDHISAEAKRLGAEVIVGIVTTGETFALYAHYASGIRYETINPHDEVAAPSGDISGKRVLPVDDTCTSGGSIKDGVEVCERELATVVGAYVTLRRDAAVDAERVGLTRDGQEFAVLYDLDFVPIVEVPDENSALIKGLQSHEFQARLNVGYMAEDGWPTIYPGYDYVGATKKKTPPTHNTVAHAQP